MPRVARRARHRTDRARIRSSPSALRRNITRSRHCFSGFDHGNLIEAGGDQPIGQHPRGLRRGRQRQRRFRQRDRMQRPLAPRPQRHRAAIERNLVRGFDLIGEARFDLGLRDRRRQQDAPAARRCRSIRRPRYRARAPAPRSGRPPRRGRWRARNCHCRGCARRDRERPKRASRRWKAPPARAAFCAGLLTADDATCDGPALRQAARAAGALRAVAAELIEP